MIDLAACPETLAGLERPRASNVVRIVPAVRRNETLCRYLREMLADAESGELVGFAAAGVFTRHRTAQMYISECYGDGVLLVGKLAEVQRAVLDWMATQ